MFRLLSDRRGVSVLEYALLAATLGLVLVTVLRVPASHLVALLRHVVVMMHTHMSSG